MARNNPNRNARLQAKNKVAATAMGTEKIPHVTTMAKKQNMPLSGATCSAVNTAAADPEAEFAMMSCRQYKPKNDPVPRAA
jgi:hypothetical protein